MIKDNSGYLNLTSVIKSFLGALQTPPQMSTTEWADNYYVVPDSANMPGPWRTSYTPHLKGIFDAFDDPECEELTVQGSAQIGKTSFLLIIIGKTIHLNPQPILVLQPTDEVARQFSETKLNDMITDCKVLRNRVDAGKSHNKKKKLFKRFPGGFLKMVGGHSPHGLRQMSIPMVISDDIDSLEIGSTKEGDPVLRAEKRSKTFEGSRKKIRCSTPTRKGSSRINAFFNMGSREKFYIPCIKCNTYQFFNKLDDIVWDTDKDMFGNVTNNYPETAKLKCRNCGYLMTEAERRQILQKGKWIAERPEIKHHRSFQVNEIASSLSSLEGIVKDYLNATKEEAYETFINTTLGECYEAKAEIEYDPLNLVNRTEDYLTEDNPYLPDGVLIITAGVDVQNDRLEAQICGWGEGEECWILGYYVFYGDIDSEEVFANIDQLRKNKWKRRDGKEIGILTTLIDSGFQGKKKMVYDYCWKRRREKNVYATKGYGNPGRELYSWAKRFNSTMDLILIGTNEAKSNLYQVRLPIEEPGAKYIHFTETFCTFNYFEQLTAEVGLRKRSGLMDYMVYEKRQQGARNEALDTWVLCYVAMALRPVNWTALKKRIEIPAHTENIKKPEPESIPFTPETITELKKEKPKPRPVKRNGSAGGGWVSSW